MVRQATEQRPNMQAREIAVFNNRNAAEKAKQLLQQQENLSLRNISIKGEIDPYEEVAAMGTTVGPEAGLLIGAFSGGIVGAIFVSIYSTLVYGDLATTTFNQLSIIAFIIAGAIFWCHHWQSHSQCKASRPKAKGQP